MDRIINSAGYSLLDLCKIHDLCILNGRFGQDRNVGAFTCYTHNGSSCIDYVLMSSSLLNHINDFAVHDYDSLLSDTHCPISLSLTSLAHVNVSVNTPSQFNGHGEASNYDELSFKWDSKSSNIYRNSISNTDINELVEFIVKIETEPSQKSIDEICSKLSQLLVEKAKDCNICKERVLYKNSNDIRNGKKHKPWFDLECRSARNEYYKVKNKIKFISPSERQSKIQKASKHFKNMLKEKKKIYFESLHKRLRVLKSNNSKDYWNFLNKASNKNNNHEMTVAFLKEHFEKISTVRNDIESSTSINFETNSINEQINVQFSLDEIKHIIKRLKSGKACGIDHVRNEFLKNCSDEVLAIVVKLFNVILNTGIIPEDWCIGMILPLYKNKGDINDPDNYRGITLLSCIGKLFTAILNERLTSYVDAIGCMGDEQAGFRHEFSTIDHIFTLHALIEYYSKKKMKLYCAFIDYRKAFDFVDRASLWSKLISTGINGNILRVIHNLYSRAKSCVKLNGKISDYFNCNVGVRQGENLSPLLFAIFLNDFEYSISRKYNGLKVLSNDINTLLSDDDVEHFLTMYVLLYADDTIVLAESPQELQNALNAVHTYCNDWKLSVNTCKTKIVVFSKYRASNLPAFLFGHDIIEVVDSYTYLGTIFNYNGSFKLAIDKQLQQGKKAFYALLSKIKKLYLPVDLSLELFNQLVVPVLTYGCEVWGTQDIKCLEILQRKFIKIILGLNQNTPNAMIYGETGIYPIAHTINMRMINFYMRIVNGKQSKFSCIMYKILRKQSQLYNLKYDWTTHIKKCLDNLGMSNIWISQGDGFSNIYVKEAVKLRSKDMFLQEWHNMKSQHLYCNFYESIKNEHELEKYLILLNYKQRIALSKFRCRSNYLPITSSRFTGEVDYSCFCPLCHKHDIGDELHYLFVCPFFIEERKRYLERTPDQINDHYVHALFNSTDIAQVSKLASFVDLIMNIFYHREKWENGIQE